MIVNYTALGWQIVSQRAHGLLAAAIANAWHHKVRTERWIETLLAVAEHDDAQTELECIDLLTSQGGPVDFSMRKMEYAHCIDTMTRAYNKSTYIALLSSMHLHFLCEGNADNKQDVKKFIEEQKAQRNKWLKHLDLSAEQLEHDYRLLEWCDALSLLLCKNESQPEGRSIEISKGPDGKMHRLKALDQATLTVEPWPFEQEHFDVYYEYCLLPQLSYKSDDEFKKAYQNCTRQTRTISFKKNNN
ncbi:DUF3891 family protein [Mucilaginibacter pallidiroseus]|uniref:DUF3891 family protein n=1 Tax=Mucilaginibacter pallidiroseus TaxID=2599295 RepID=A0A563TZC9_9SPHI|nr:DUF3891 family protein [Mucilaginibacter pallidiroseus]TWR24716.1 DUF3891 family protein [Mucilaginibacter pallidiroseus]